MGTYSSSAASDPRCGARALLRQHRIFRSRNVEEARAFLRRTEFLLEEINPRAAGALDMHINGVPMPGTSGGGFGYFRYGLAVSVRAVGREEYWIQLPTRGAFEVVSACPGIICDARHAAVLSPTCRNYYVVRTSGDCERLCLSLGKASIVEQLAVYSESHQAGCWNLHHRWT